MAVNTYNPILLAGTQAQFDALNGTYVADKLYFTTDTGKLYRANSASAVVDYTNNLEVVENRPVAPVAGKIYKITSLGTVEAWNGSAWIVLTYEKVTSMSSDSTDAQVPSAKAVFDAIEAATGSGNLVKSIAQAVDASDDPIIGSITVTKADNTTSNVALAGLAKLPTYQASDRTFTFTDTSGGSLVVTLGKDEFIDPTANNRYENGYLYIYLNVPDPDVPGSTNTEIAIDVSSLVADYVGDDTDTIDLTVDVNTHTVTADVIVRPDVSGTFTNALKVSTTTGAKGLYVDLSTVETDIYNLQNMTTGTSTLVSTVYDHSAELTNIHNAWGWGTFS